jgi:hypothetical protein
MLAATFEWGRTEDGGWEVGWPALGIVSSGKTQEDAALGLKAVTQARIAAALNVPSRAEIMSALACEFSWGGDDCQPEDAQPCEACKMRWRLSKLDGFELRLPESVTRKTESGPVEASQKAAGRPNVTRSTRKT